jgi:hypothetical protein
MGIVVLEMPISRHAEVPGPVGWGGMPNAVHAIPSILYSISNVDILEAVVDFQAPNVIPIVSVA